MASNDSTRPVSAGNVKAMLQHIKDEMGGGLSAIH